MQILTRKRTLRRRRITTVIAWAVLALLTGFSQFCFSQQPNQKTFSSAEEGARSLFLAVKENNADAITAILGVESNLISQDDVAADGVSTDDQDQNKSEHAQFIEKYQEMRRLVREPDGTIVLYLGAENWPFPVPLVSRNRSWYFDANAGTAEILFRRIGENEEAAINASHLLVLAEGRYRATLHNDDPTSHYALRFASSNGTQDGLYSDGDSTIPAFLAKAGVSDDTSSQSPFAGYYFRILTQQGKDAGGGTQDYMSNGKLTGGVAFVAYPAKYGQSGAMTFIVNQDDVVYEKDLGPDTANIVQAMSRYNPGPGWRRAE